MLQGDTPRQGQESWGQLRSLAGTGREQVLTTEGCSRRSPHPGRGRERKREHMSPREAEWTDSRRLVGREGAPCQPPGRACSISTGWRGSRPSGAHTVRAQVLVLRVRVRRAKDLGQVGRAWGNRGRWAALPAQTCQAPSEAP